jgi:hypothetical protein
MRLILWARSPEIAVPWLYVVLVSKIDRTSLNAVTQEQHCALKLFQPHAFVFSSGIVCVLSTWHYKQNIYFTCRIIRRYYLSLSQIQYALSLAVIKYTDPLRF